MPQQRRRTNNKKKKGKGNSACNTCAQCAKPVIKKADRIECICTRVIYCSSTCQNQSMSGKGRHKCPGPPEQVTNIKEKLKECSTTPGLQSFRNSKDKEEWTKELRRTVSRPCQEYQRREGGIAALAANPSVDTYKAAADLGHAPSAYMAGINYKNRLLGEYRFTSSGEIVSDNADAAKQLGVLKTDKLAFQYLHQAAEAGIGVAMQSLSDCYEKGQGCEINKRMCDDWLWRAVLQKSANASYMLDTKCLTGLEHRAFSDQLETMQQYLQMGQTAKLSGPNLSALMMSLSDTVVRNYYMLPPFAATVPTFTVDNRPNQGSTGPVKIVCAEDLKEFLDARDFLRSQFFILENVYGRRGTAKAATAQIQGEASRSLDNQIYVVPHAPACDDTPTKAEVDQWKALVCKPPFLAVHCIHVEEVSQRGGPGQPWPVCEKCIKAALKRMSAVACSSVVFSLQEALPAHGQAAIIKDLDGTIRSESFKTYSRCDVECALATLVAARDDPTGLLCRPLFVAQDPNLFWPLIYYHGTIRAALEFVAPHVDWNALIGRVRSCPEPAPLAAADDITLSPGDTMKKCGSDLCYNLEIVPGSFLCCSRCQRRDYCGQKCQKNDFALHRMECKPASKGSERKPTPQEPMQTKEKCRETEPRVDEYVIIHGLQAKPKFNGMLARVTDERKNDRYPVKVDSQEKPILVKPTNLYCIGVNIAESSTGKNQFECSLHESIICSECCVDFSAVNNLARLKGPIGREAIETIANTHFATIEQDWEFMEGKFDPGIPMECQGVNKEDRRFVLKSLLKIKGNESVVLSAAISGMATYSGRRLLAARPDAIPHLVAFVDLLQSQV